MKRATLYLLVCILFAWPISGQVQLLNMHKLTENKHSKAKTLVAARQAIVREADKILMLTPVSVMDKDRIAPSGDKHDYYSMARYWWPNPKTEDGLPYIRKDGQNNPETKGLDRDNLSLFSRHIEILSLAYFYSENEVYADKAWDYLRTWYLNKKTKMNPHMEYSQVVLGRDNNKGRGEGLLDTYSMLLIPDVIHILSTSKKAKGKDIIEIQKWFSCYLQWMLTSEQGIDEHSSKNNHGTAYDIQIAAYAGYVGDTITAQQYIQNFVPNRIEKQIEADGRQPFELVRTTSFGYSCFNLKHILDMADIASSKDIDLLAKNSHAAELVKQAINYLTPYLEKNVSAWPYEQIKDWEKVQQDLCWILYRADKYFPEEGYKAIFDRYNTAKNSDRKYLLY